MLLKAREIYQFGGFQLDSAARTLWRDTGVVTLNRRAFDVLLYLVRNPGKLISRDELLKNVWPDAFVDENSLSQSISALRRALDEKPDNHSYIATVPGRGYQFISPVYVVASEFPAEVEPKITPGTEQGIVSAQAFVGLQTVSERTRTVEEESTAPSGRQWPARRAAIWVGVGVLAIALATVAGLRLTHAPSYGHAGAVIADLDNETGDTDFDHSLNRMLQIDLQQSPYFTVVGEGRAREILKMMRQPVDERITAPLAREICQRLNGQVFITPAIAKVGDRYLLTVEANDCEDGHSLGADHKEAASKGEVLAAFGALTRQVRRHTGESAASLRQFDKPLFNQTTASLDALKAYTEATRLFLSGRSAEAIALYQRAIELDPNFAAAYADMASVYYDMGDEGHDREMTIKAFALRDTVNEYERFFIEYGYHMSVTGDLQAELAVLRQWASTYPRDYVPLAALINLETMFGQYAAAAAHSDRMLDVQRRDNINSGIAYEMAARAYHRANMPDKVRAAYAEALQSKAESEGLHTNMLEFAAEHGDNAGVEREIAWSRGKPEESRVLQVAGLAALAAGQAHRAEDLFAQATVAAQRDKLQDTLADYDDYRARMLVELGMVKEAKALLKVLPPFDTALDMAFTEAEVGDAPEALHVAQRQQAANPNDTLLNAVYSPSVRAAVALRESKPKGAVMLLQLAAPFELHDPTIPYLRGQAYLAAGQSSEAEIEFEKISDHPWLADPPAVVISLAHLGFARALAQQGQFDASRRQYEALFTLWKNADRDLPILEQAQREYARLK